MSETAAASSYAEELDSGADLRHLVSWWRAVARYGSAILSGLLLSAAFPPVEWDWLIWLAFIPLLLAPAPPTTWRRCMVGYIFGFAHFVTSLLWLNEIGFAAGVLLAFACAFFPMIWYVLSATLTAQLNSSRSALAQATNRLAPVRSGGAVRYAILVILIPAAWVAIEWVRSWIFTGFSWNQLGISQFQRGGLIRPVIWTGVYGISFLIVAGNYVLIWLVKSWWQRLRHHPEREFPLPVMIGILLMLPGFYLVINQPEYGRPLSILQVAGIQGNIPQTRSYSQAQLGEIVTIYDDLTRRAVRAGTPDLVIWPETAVPAPARYDPLYNRILNGLFRDVQTPMLIGTLDYRPAAGQDNSDDMLSLNSVLYYGPNGELLDFYNKTHLVPFGEYVPFEAHLPWLVDWIGMGRSLTPGTEYTVFQLPQQADAGVNICYEDAYPQISRRFVLNGANVLMTLTNDAWYAESAGPRQHLIHAVFRAVENQRPLFRSGNNSDTCLILPNGRIVGELYDTEAETKFVRDFGLYDVPVWKDLPVTFYTRYGDVFAKTCALIAAVTAAILIYAAFRQKRALAEQLERDTGTA